jgi:TolB protein
VHAGARRRDGGRDLSGCERSHRLPEAAWPQQAAIFTVDPNGTSERQLTHPGRHRWTTEPNWSPSGRWIVYDVQRHADPENARIFKIRANGTHRHSLDRSCTAPCLSDTFPAWSPGGRRIVFGRALGPSVGTNNVGAIVVMAANGSHVRRITQRGADPSTEQPYTDDDPTWSPKGGRIAFQRIRRSDKRHAIFTVRVDGSGARRLTPWTLDCSSPDWAPGGRWIAFRTHENSDRRGDIGLVRPQGTHLHLITQDRSKWGLLSFSPDGRIAATQEGVDIYEMRRDGSDVRLVVGGNATDGVPGWGPRREKSSSS